MLGIKYYNTNYRYLSGNPLPDNGKKCWYLLGVGTEAPQKKKKGVATFGVALPSKKDPGRERTLKRDKRIL